MNAPDCGCCKVQLVDTGSVGRFWTCGTTRPTLAVGWLAAPHLVLAS